VSVDLAVWHLKGTVFCRSSCYTAGNRRILYRIEGSATSERVVVLGVLPRNVASREAATTT